MFSVNTEEEAEQLLAMSCELVTYGRDYQVGYIARELEQKQTIPNLFAFGKRLAANYRKLKSRRKGATT